MRLRHVALLTLMFVAGGCGENPIEPPILPPVENPVTMVDLTSSTGSIVAVNGQLQLAATPRDADGATTDDAATWTSSSASVATVTAAGLVTGVARGTATITATAGSVSSTLSIAVADPDMSSIRRLLDDPFGDALVGAAGAGIAATWANCSTASTSGNLSALSDCLAQLSSDLDAGTAESAPIRAVADLVADWLTRLLNL